MPRPIPSELEDPSAGGPQSRSRAPMARPRGKGLEHELARLGFLPTKEYPLLYRGLGLAGFGLFLYLEGPLDLQTLNRLAKCTDRTAVLKKCFATAWDQT